MEKERLGYILLAVIGVIAFIGFAWSSPIEQSTDYHNFSDTLTVGIIPNFWNVISNLPFLLVGIFGLFRLKKMDRLNLQFLTFFSGISFVAIGSGYYHLHPDSSTLVWDRLPMTIAFTALMSIVISEFINRDKGKMLLIPLLLLGIVSIVYWLKFDDLRVYALVQFYPVLAIPVILILFRSEENSPNGFWFLLMTYVIAKLLETYDFEIHTTLKYISGHSLKHISASIGIYLLIHSYIRQNKNNAGTLHV